MADFDFTGIRSLAECGSLRGMRVLVRAGIDAPLDQEGHVVDDFRVRKSLPTLSLLRAAGARIIIIGHTSRADGSSDASLQAVCETLNTYIPTSWGGDILEDSAIQRNNELQEGEIVMFENLRFHTEEKGNDDAFAHRLSSMADLFVNDAFSVSHREHASIVGIPKHLPSCAGEQFMDELRHLSLARTPHSPSLFVLGGAKFETKLPLVEALLPQYDHVFIGGALANNFFKARGLEVGASLVSEIDLSTSPLLQSPKLLLPIDVVVRSERGTAIKTPDEVARDEAILDAGPKTIELLREKMRTVATLLWNGPLGDYERGFSDATTAFAKIVAESRGVTLVGGGDTVASMHDTSITDRFTFMSTAGGAMLTFLEKGTLPGIEALRNSPAK